MEWIQTNWVTIVAVVVAVHTALKAIAVAIDKDPTTDNAFERAIKFLGNIVGYIATGKRK